MNEPADRSQDAVERARGLEAEHRHLASQFADVAAFSAQVHDRAADVHDDMDHPLLSPEALRAHAQLDRELEASERKAAQEPPTD
jgi:hypothetical protein